MSQYYEAYKTLIVATTMLGLYFSVVERIYKGGCIKIFKIFAVIPALVLPVYFIFAIKYVFYDESKFVAQMFGGIQLLYSFFASFVIFSFYYNVKDFKRVFELWDSLFKGDLYPDDRQELLNGNTKITNGWLKIFGGFGVISSAIYSSYAYFNSEKKLRHQIGIPYRHQSPDFELVVTFELLVTVYGFSTLVTYDSITMALLSLEQAQFVHLKESLARIIKTLSVRDSGKIDLPNEEPEDDLEVDHVTPKPERVTHKIGANRLIGHILWGIKENEQSKQVLEEVKKKLILWITHHQEVLRFHDELQQIYHVSLSIKFMVFVMMICLVSFLTVVDGGFTTQDTLMAFAFCINNYSLFYVIIKFGDSIRDTSDFIFEDAFGSSWYIYPKNLITMLMIITMRSNRPVQYFAWKIYPLSSRSFLKILTSAYTFFTFLMYIMRRNHVEA